MKNSKKQKQLEKLIREGKRDERESLIWFQSGRTVRSVDFQHIENNPHGTEHLTPFELEVKEKLAGAPSPYDELARIEEENDLEAEEHARKTRLGRLAYLTDFTDQERQCYELYYEQKCSDVDVRKKMEISHSHFCHLRRQIQEKLIATHKSYSTSKYRKRKPGARAITPRQQEVLDLRAKGISFQEIAIQLGVSVPTVHQIYKRGLKKFLYRETA